MRSMSAGALLQAYLDARIADPRPELDCWAQSVLGLLADAEALAQLARRVSAHDGGSV